MKWLLKSVWDVLKDQKVVRNFLEKRVAGAIKFIKKGKLAGLESTAVSKLVELTEGIGAPDFPTNIDPFEFVKFLLAQVVLTVNLRGRGVLICNFYLPDSVLYFPRPQTPPIKRHRYAMSNAWEFYGYVEKEWQSGDKDFYTFYAIPIESGSLEAICSKLNERLDELVLKMDETASFKNAVVAEGLRLDELTQIVQYASGKIALTKTLLDWEKDAIYFLDFTDGAAARKVIAEGLRHCLTFSMVG